MSLRLPYPPYLRIVVRRSLWLWLLLRVAHAGAIVLAVIFFGFPTVAEAAAQAVRPTLVTRVVLVGLVAVLVWWDRRRSRELLLHANLAASPVWFVAASMVAALVAELAVEVLLAVL